MATGQVISVVPGAARGQILFSGEPLSFWGGVDPATGGIMDVHHPLHGECLTGKVLVLPGTRGSCTGSGVILDLLQNGRGPAALIFAETEDVVTLGVMVAAELFGLSVPILRVDAGVFDRLRSASEAEIVADQLAIDGAPCAVASGGEVALALTVADQAMADGANGEAAAVAMRIICRMARQQGATALVDVTRGHIDGCIYASPANLTFAERFRAMGARVAVPTTMNAISVDYDNWRAQGTPPSFGGPAEKLAAAYVAMGCQPTFTCSPYLLDDAPAEGERIAWAESNAVIYANTVLGARTPKHPDFLDLCIAITGRAPLSGVYLDEPRQARRVIEVVVPQGVDDAFWPLVGYVAGRLSPDRIPCLHGLQAAAPSRENLKALCAAFGTTSAAPMLHVAGVTPEAAAVHPQADRIAMTLDDLRQGWQALNGGPEGVQLVAIGSPHASLAECRGLAQALAGRNATVPLIITAGRNVIAAAQAEGLAQQLETAGAQIVPDLCWCSITEPLFPSATRAVMTNSGKYAHYGPGLSGRPVRFGGLVACAEAAVTGHAAPGLPGWLAL